jgi:hypothetical protein
MAAGVGPTQFRGEFFNQALSGQPEIVWVTPLSQKLAQPRNTEEFL